MQGQISCPGCRPRRRLHCKRHPAGNVCTGVRECGGQAEVASCPCISPPQPPSPVLEESEEGSSPRPSISDNGNLNALELLAATRAYAEDIQQERSSENLALISRLTEEKNAAIQQNNKLRQELELDSREVSKQQGGFSFVFLVIIALLGIFLGYIVKK